MMDVASASSEFFTSPDAASLSEVRMADDLICSATWRGRGRMDMAPTIGALRGVMALRQCLEMSVGGPEMEVVRTSMT